MDLLTGVLFFIGLGLLVVGAESLVRGASRIASTLGISPLVVGLTIVAFGTSAPELAVSVSSSISGSDNVAIGNVVGSNIFNILVILGLSAIVAPLVVTRQLIRLDVPLMVGASIVFYLFALNGVIGRIEGIVLFSGIVAYTTWAIVSSRRASAEVVEEYAEEFGATDRSAGRLLFDLGRVIVGLGCLVVGSDWFVEGATKFAEALGVSDLVIGLTLVAAGTSMPELATSVVASIRGERDIAVGNVVGSNLFNLMSVIGMSAIVVDGGIPVADTAIRIDIPIMLGVAVICLPIFVTGAIITRWNGLMLFGLYVGYVIYLYLDATASDAVSDTAANAIRAAFVILAVILGALAYFDIRRKPGEAPGAPLS